MAPRTEPYGSALSINLGQGMTRNTLIDVKVRESKFRHAVHSYSSDTSRSQCRQQGNAVHCSGLPQLKHRTENILTCVRELGKALVPQPPLASAYPTAVSQCQAIHARSIFPCQDTPDVKSTFDFCIESELPVIASGIRKDSQKLSRSSDNLYRFGQKVPMPSYLFAIASGDIVGASIGPRSEVWTSPDHIRQCQWELEHDTENFIQTAEKLVYSYQWGTYNALVLPPSFPYGYVRMVSL